MWLSVLFQEDAVKEVKSLSKYLKHKFHLGLVVESLHGFDLIIEAQGILVVSILHCSIAELGVDLCQ